MDPTIWTPTVMLAIVSAVSAIMLAAIAQFAAVLVAYFKLRAMMAANTDETIKGKNAAIGAANLGKENRDSLAHQKEALIPAVAKQTAAIEKIAADQKDALLPAVAKLDKKMDANTDKITDAISTSGVPAMPSRDVARLLNTVQAVTGGLFVAAAKVFCRGRTDRGGEFIGDFHDKFLPELTSVRRQLDLGDVPISRIIGEVLSLVDVPLSE